MAWEGGVRGLECGGRVSEAECAGMWGGALGIGRIGWGGDEGRDGLTA